MAFSIIFLAILCFLVYFAGMFIIHVVQKAKKQRIQEELDHKQEEKELKAQEKWLAKDKKEHPDKYLGPPVHPFEIDNPLFDSTRAAEQRLQYVGHMNSLSHVYGNMGSQMYMQAATSFVSNHPSTFQTAIGAQINHEQDLRRQEELYKVLTGLTANVERLHGKLTGVTGTEGLTNEE